MNKKNYIIIGCSVVSISLIISLMMEKFIYSNEPIDFNRFFINFGISIILIILFILINNIIYKNNIDSKIIKKFKNVTINKVFICISIIIGITFSFCFPLTQIPDEITHINMIYEERNLDIKFSDIDDGYSGYEDLSENDHNKVNKNEYFDLSKKIDTGLRLSIPKLTIIRHFPQYIGMLIGEMLHLPVFLYLTLCELFALAFYIAICNLALKKIPFKKPLMMFIMLLPICCQQMSSFSYDVVLNSFCFLFIAYIMNLKFAKEKITMRDILILLGCLLVISICKIPYVLLGLLVFILPLHKFEFKTKKRTITFENIKNIINKHKKLYLIIAIVLIIIFCISAYQVLSRIYIGKIFLASILNFTDTLQLFKRSLDIFLPYYLETIVGNLGIFNVDTSLLFEIFVYISLILVAFFNYKVVKNKLKVEKINFNIKDNIIIYCVVVLFVYVIILSMYEWTLYCTKIPNYKSFTIAELGDYISKLPYIGGVQGRYFVPILPLILIPLSSSKITNKLLRINPIVYQIIYYLILYVYLIIVLLNRYWM